MRKRDLTMFFVVVLALQFIIRLRPNLLFACECLHLKVKKFCRDHSSQGFCSMVTFIAKRHSPYFASFFLVEKEIKLG